VNSKVAFQLKHRAYNEAISLERAFVVCVCGGREARMRLQRRVHTTTIFKFRLLALKQDGLKEFGVL
jgi:hypothetical protein